MSDRDVKPANVVHYDISDGQADVVQVRCPAGQEWAPIDAPSTNIEDVTCAACLQLEAAAAHYQLSRIMIALAKLVKP